MTSLYQGLFEQIILVDPAHLLQGSAIPKLSPSRLSYGFRGTFAGFMEVLKLLKYIALRQLR